MIAPVEAVEACITIPEDKKAPSPPPSPPDKPGAWSSDCCDCCSEMCTCCAGCWCPCFTIPQVSARTKNNAATFGKFCAILWILNIVYYGVYYWFYYGDYGYNARLEFAVRYGVWDLLTNPDYWGTEYTVSQILYCLVGLTLLITTTCMICTARKKIVQRDGIPEDGCASCCISCCPCSAPCAVCQMMRHEGMSSANGYNLCDPMGAAKGTTKRSIEMPVATSTATA